jgi:hypothetical protein
MFLQEAVRSQALREPMQQQATPVATAAAATEVAVGLMVKRELQPAAAACGLGTAEGLHVAEAAVERSVAVIVMLGMWWVKAASAEGLGQLVLVKAMRKLANCSSSRDRRLR